MAKLLVAIEIPNLTEAELRDRDNQWFEGKRVVVDEAYLHRAVGDDSFFAFEYRGIEE